MGEETPSGCQKPKSRKQPQKRRSLTGTEKGPERQIKDTEEKHEGTRSPRLHFDGSTRTVVDRKSVVMTSRTAMGGLSSLHARLSASFRRGGTREGCKRTKRNQPKVWGLMGHLCRKSGSSWRTRNERPTGKTGGGFVFGLKAIVERG